jgi:protein arginine kinase activator
VICERCNKKLATLKFTEVVKGKAILRNICETCMNELQGNPSAAFEMTGAPAAKVPIVSRRESAPAAAQRECPSCGIALREVAHAGRLGCAECLSAFSGLIEPMVRSLHFAPQHQGKVPQADDSREQLRVDLRSKRALLRTALKMENYEEAAVLRDNIRTLESKLGSTHAETN